MQHQNEIAMCIGRIRAEKRPSLAKRFSDGLWNLLPGTSAKCRVYCLCGFVRPKGANRTSVRNLI